LAEDMRIFLGLGSNLDDRYQNLMNGIQQLNDHAHIWVIDESHVYQTPAMYSSDQQDFYNMVIEIETNLNPLQLLDEVKIIEMKLGREPNKKKNMPRSLDVDILAVGDILIRSKLLEIPHPKIVERKFVLKPWNDIAPDFLVPDSDKKIIELLKITKDRSQIRMVLI
jgi:2-amino-4-hydroxy-6-hydroxymethyldihydropteridine diphosphokinase